MKYTQIELSPSRKASQEIKEKVKLTVIEAKEDSLDKKDSIHWILFTSFDVKGFSQLQLLIDFYSLRWKIESFFKILKSGCNIEKCRLGEGSRLKKYIALFSIIAWRIFWMTFIGRFSPKQSCDLVFTESEWQTLFCIKHKTKEPLQRMLMLFERIVKFL